MNGLPEISAIYGGPSPSGDVYVICVVPPGVDQLGGDPGPLVTATATLKDAAGRTAFSVSLDDFDESGEDGTQLIATYPDGSRRLHGVQLNSWSVVAIPFFLPDEHRAASYRFTYRNDFGSRSVGFPVDPSCGDLAVSSGPNHDPLDFDTIEVNRSWPNDIAEMRTPNDLSKPFDHCRFSPDVEGLEIAAAVQQLERYAADTGRVATVEVIPGDCPDGLVVDQTIRLSETRRPRSFPRYAVAHQPIYRRSLGQGDFPGASVLDVQVTDSIVCNN